METSLSSLSTSSRYILQMPSSFPCCPQAAQLLCNQRPNEESPGVWKTFPRSQPRYIEGERSRRQIGPSSEKEEREAPFSGANFASAREGKSEEIGNFPGQFRTCDHNISACAPLHVLLLAAHIGGCSPPPSREREGGKTRCINKRWLMGEGKGGKWTGPTFVFPYLDDVRVRCGVRNNSFSGGRMMAFQKRFRACAIVWQEKARNLTKRSI